MFLDQEKLVLLRIVVYLRILVCLVLVCCQGRTYTLVTRLNTVQSDLWVPLADQEWRSCAMPPSRRALPAKTRGYIQVFLDGGLNQQRMRVCDAVAVAKILDATLVIPYLEVNPVWQDSSSFTDIFNVDHFIDVLKDDISIVRELPLEYEWSTREYYATAIRATIVKSTMMRSNGGGSAGVGVGSAINKLNYVVAMIVEVRSMSNALNLPVT